MDKIKNIDKLKDIPNKMSNDVAQMKYVNDLKQWVIDNFLSLSGGTVNGDIFANKFEEN